MEVKITAQLPFSWCQSCDQRDLRTEKLIADGEVFDSQTTCENAPICEACERARNEATETTLVIGPDKRKNGIPTEAVLRTQAMIDRYRQKANRTKGKPRND